MPLVSVVIPVLRDEPALHRALADLGMDDRFEVVVVNGGPDDHKTTAPARGRPDVKWLWSAPGRGRQMNRGASAAAGDWLLFLHADTRLAPRWLDELERITPNSAIVGGSFRFGLDSASPWARIIERGVAGRVRWFNLPYGDQALFVRRSVFARLRGYVEWPLMEDVDLVRRLARVGRLHHSRIDAITSARRWERDGWVRRSTRNLLLLGLYFAGVSPLRLARLYEQRRRR